MRMIDAEQFEYIGYQATGEQRYDDGFAEGVMFISERINSAPTIDAIPVEWMRDKMRGYASALKSTELKALVTVMQMWQKEQEAR